MNCLKCGRTVPENTLLCADCLRERAKPTRRQAELAPEKSKEQQIAALRKRCRSLRRALALFVAAAFKTTGLLLVSALLIIIFEKSSTIGVLKALGATGGSIRNIFLQKAAELVAKGIVLGNAVALPLCWVQQRFAIVQLDSESYSMSSVPIDLNIWIFVAVSAGTAAVCVAAMLLPAAYISKVEPAKTIKWN